MDAGAPDRIPETRRPPECLFAGGIFFPEFFCLQKRPVLNPVLSIQMVLGVEIGRDVLRVPAEIVGYEELRRVLISPNELPCRDTELLQRGLQVGRVLLP